MEARIQQLEREGHSLKSAELIAATMEARIQQLEREGHSLKSAELIAAAEQRAEAAEQRAEAAEKRATEANTEKEPAEKAKDEAIRKNWCVVLQAERSRMAAMHRRSGCVVNAVLFSTQPPWGY